MLATPHALVGALIASKFPDPAVGLPIAFFSHFLFDMVPHWDWGWHPNQTVRRISDPTKRMRIFYESAFDVLLGFVLSFIFFGSTVNHLYLFAIIIAAQGPDWLCMPKWLFGVDIGPINFICKLQHLTQRHARLPWGILNQIIAVIAFGVLLHFI